MAKICISNLGDADAAGLGATLKEFCSEVLIGGLGIAWCVTEYVCVCVCVLKCTFPALSPEMLIVQGQEYSFNKQPLSY